MGETCDQQAAEIERLTAENERERKMTAYLNERVKVSDNDSLIASRTIKQQAAEIERLKACVDAQSATCGKCATQLAEAVELLRRWELSTCKDVQGDLQDETNTLLAEIERLNKQSDSHLLELADAVALLRRWLVDDTHQLRRETIALIATIDAEAKVEQ